MFNVQHSTLGGHTHGAVADRYFLPLFAMMRPSTRRPPKWPIPLEVFPSPGSVEFVSMSRTNGRLVKQRRIEDAKVDPLLFHDPTLSVDISSLQTDDLFSLPTGAEVSWAAEHPSTEPEIDTASRSASVSTLLYCHVTVCSHSVDTAHQMGPVPSTLYQ